MMKVQNMTSPRTGREVANQFIIRDSARTVFQSYSSMIACIDYKNKSIEIGSNWDYSVTTGKYRNQFFSNEGWTELACKAGLEKAIKDGKIDDFIVKMV